MEQSVNGAAPRRSGTLTWLRVGLAFLTLTQFAVGSWALVFPRSFFDIPVVGMGMPYNAHLMMDYGAMSLATSVILGVSVFVPQPIMVRTALAVYLVFAVPHLVIHVRLLHHLTPGLRAPLLIGLATAVVIALVLLALTRSLPSATATAAHESRSSQYSSGG